VRSRAHLLVLALLACEAKQIQAFPDKYAGVGVELELHESRPRITEVHMGGAADKGGLVAGDVILSVDGIDTEGLTLAQVVDRLRGDDGSAVAIRFQRGPAEREVKLARARVKKSRGGGYRAE